MGTVSCGLQVAVSCRGPTGALEVELSVGLGEVVAVLGRPEAGKTTLIDIVSGIRRPDRGTVRLDGRVLTNTTIGRHVPVCRRPIALLDRHPLLFPDLSVVDNVTLAARLCRATPDHATAEARDWLDAVGIAHLAHHRVDELVPDQVQRVGLARALALRPVEVLLLDDPFTARDATVLTGLRGVLWNRITLLTTDHEPTARALADRVLLLRSGRLVPTGR